MTEEQGIIEEQEPEPEPVEEVSSSPFVGPPVIQRADGTYIIYWCGNPNMRYAVIEEIDEALYHEVKAWAEANPEQVEHEPEPEVPEPPPFHPGPDYELIDGVWTKVRFSKIDFVMFCGFSFLVDLNEVIADGNADAAAVKDLLMSASYIDITDPNTAQMLNILASEQGGNILTSDDVTRILAGEVYREPKA